jgi:catechol 2,3-dioxygenase-like lactoylglutathione lyase family enzyme
VNAGRTARGNAKIFRYTGINHLAMATGDMGATIRFWRDLLGMRLVARLGRSGCRHYFFEISPNDMIAFFEWNAIEKIPEKDHGVSVRGPFAFDHISLGLASREELWRLKDKLEAAGFPFHTDRGTAGLPWGRNRAGS